MLVHDIQKELGRLQLHPANLEISSVDDGRFLLRGSLLAHWAVPKIIDGDWFLSVLNGLPDAAGPKATMDAFCAAHAQKAAGKAAG